MKSLDRPIWAARPNLLAALGLLLLHSGLSLHARAQNYSIDGFKIAAGGGTSAGGVYSVSGTIGQPDAGTQNGNTFLLVGGFWGFVSVLQTPGAPLLAIRRGPIPGFLTVFWSTPADGWVLDEAAGVNASAPTTLWTQVVFPYETNGTEISISVVSPVGNRFYRLRKP